MAQEWYYTKDGDRQGPVAPQQLKQLAASGDLQPTDLIWKDGMAEWKPAKSLKGLFQATSQPKATQPPSISGYSKPTAPAPTDATTDQPGPLKKAMAKFRGLTTPQKILVGGAAGMGMFFFLCIGMCGLAGLFVAGEEKAAAEKTAKANALWEQGEQEDAIVLYRELAEQKLFIPEGQRPIVFGRLIDHEAKNGNTKEVRRLLKMASSFKPDIRSDEAKQIVPQLMAEIENERQAEIAEKEAEQKTKDILSQSVLTLSSSDMVDFIDNTKKYKGKLIRMKLSVRDNTIRSGGVGLEFYELASSGSDSIALKVRISVLPSSIDPLAEFDSLDDLPNASGADRVVVTFLCEEGSLNHGNRAIRIVRP